MLKNIKLIIPLAAILMLSTAVFANAQSQMQDQSWQDQGQRNMQSYDFKDNPKNLKIDRDQAWQKANEFYNGNGELKEVELDDNDGRPVWKVEVEQKFMDYDIMVDANSGEVIEVKE